ncbi:hypothetical protein RxyAA322_12040 [Rubrobacter xylanophilus]|uniref:Gram-positive cocci surface proteins LPxTG domain-containing protein n=1 Tax=Rubrobacter xylanophilus TaxID=49319 RepID=A0A510HH96_9ACTN|nr:hypothetical protein [Rubrobacter xylanophilus]BBL79350.1 hypothetical protein RxyAA322_12040 [Rubrobacter xylanophilus]
MEKGRWEVNASRLSGMTPARWLIPALLAALLLLAATPAAYAQRPADTQYTPRVAVESGSTTPEGRDPGETPAWSGEGGGQAVGLLPTTGGPLLGPAAAALVAGAVVAVVIRRMRR